jgi:hypothetical protein
VRIALFIRAHRHSGTLLRSRGGAPPEFCKIYASPKQARGMERRVARRPWSCRGLLRTRGRPPALHRGALRTPGPRFAPAIVRSPNVSGPAAGGRSASGRTPGAARALRVRDASRGRRTLLRLRTPPEAPSSSRVIGIYTKDFGHVKRI